jgi:hypothetical protein
VLGTPGDDAIFVGQHGVALNADGDVDVTFAPLPAGLEIRGGGCNSISGQGSQGPERGSRASSCSTRAPSATR